MKTWTARNKVNTADSRGGRESQKRLDGSTAEMGGRGPAHGGGAEFWIKAKNKQTNEQKTCYELVPGNIPRTKTQKRK